MLWYFVVRFLTTTGVRVSELVKIKVEHVQKGYLDLYSKGGKMRRIYFPISLRKEALSWLKEIGRDSGHIFLNRSGKSISERGIAERLKFHGKRYGLDETVLHPHSFRHRFAKSFLERYNDIALLADLMGHDSIETTRIYLRKTSTEQAISFFLQSKFNVSTSTYPSISVIFFSAFWIRLISRPNAS
ncbi:MAG: tyrosine-type recombinase/integrase [Clostridiales bacterium]|nr:tyrosine-type recombinase/integrase [Clostridiales bacterium]